MGTCGQVQSPNDVIQEIGKTMNTHIKATKPKQWFPQHQETPPPPHTHAPPPNPAPTLPLLYYALFFFNCYVTQSHNVNQILRKQLYWWLSADCTKPKRFRPHTHVWSHKATMPGSSKRGVKQLCRAISKRCCFGVRIAWFRVDRRPICVKVNAVSKKSRFVFLWPQC